MSRPLSPAPPASTRSVRARMQAQARRDTGCELLLRRALFARGLRYRVHRRVLPELRREADIVFPSRRVAVFVDGCFWHGCRAHKGPVITNGEWWREKIARTVRRDRQTDRALRRAGWTVVRIWEHTEVDPAIGLVLRALNRP